ncbi:helix-turn-helix transcriptional regulator [Thalassobius sp. I31.1]|uniref:helix-turn-helix domain-containing protein n=1 Tax=Thalassobius sp. I31.1 TaxID=2109912 RepID=UPI000D1BC97D|nr:helix-turn-helix transcriptional regulator [Thalassobius sp. I31.1]
MAITTPAYFIRRHHPVSLDRNLVQLRKAKGLTQDQMAELTGVHISSIRSYEAGRATPSAEVVKNIAIALSVSADQIIFKAGERDPDDELRLQFEALSKLPLEDQKTISNLIDSLVVKNQTLNMAHLLDATRRKQATGD